MAKRKTNEERIRLLETDIKVIEERRAADLQRLQEKRRLLGEIETEEVMKQVKAYKLSPSELKAFLQKHASGAAEDLPEKKKISDEEPTEKENQ